MARESTLLAHLVPRVTSQVENAATDALAFILNKSAACRKALDGLLRYQNFASEPIVKVETQVAEDDQSRPDMVGYDQSRKKCLLVESKFWAGLGKDQATRHLENLDADGPAVLLFICPESRVETLWTEVGRQLESEEDGVQLNHLIVSGQTRRAEVTGRDQHVMLISWDHLLDSLAADAPRDSGLVSDIRQLRGLAKYQDEEAFLPIHPQEFGLSFPRRVRGLNRLIDDVVTRGVSEEWMSIKRLAAAATRNYYGRFVRVTDIPDGTVFLCRDYRLWVTAGETPVWLRISDRIKCDMEKLQRRIPSMVTDVGKRSVPIHLKTGAEYESVLDDAFQQVKAIADNIRASLLGTKD